ncbi:hypothetical protein TTHERM_000522988 (macronuclear) [Tetrahymena thermophila SB210]|uniref:Uncharacterized protein n=1 Tax=Tetrahymena thermophila (strain SB210) TaxID=312017 RepID=W7XIJ1_TETTS|nr:hypothetical protein TTHERM_000522988 [Tetrahymena thermophila SB210]EWS74696.1 hypothetical protein TTHERM_000522988 [Tetrahymena thermophila SB210]|eukprot:XP_012652786.1 hypothetical protein TTHERM_000522988 [Tetrahymena thermophila SB210]
MVICACSRCLEYNLDEEQIEFVKDNFNKFFKDSLQIDYSKGHGSFKIIVRDEYIFRGQHLSSFPLTYCMTPFHEYPHKDKVERILTNELRVNDQNVIQTANFVFLVLFLKSEKNQQDSHTKFLNEYLNLEYINKASIVFWDQQKALEQLQQKLYYVDVQYINNIFQQIEGLIEITQLVIQSLEINEGVVLNKNDFDRSEIQKAIAFIKQNTIFLNYGQTIFNREEKILPIIIPFFELIQQGPSNKQQILQRLCKISDSPNDHIRINQEEQQLYIYSDCDFLKEEFFFIVPRHESSLEQFMNFGVVNENLDSDSLVVKVNTTSIFQSESQQKIAEQMNLSNPILKLKTGQLDYQLLQIFSLRHYFRLNKSKQSDFKQIENELSSDEQYTRFGKIDYLKFLETLIIERGKLSDDWKNVYTYKMKRYDSKQRFEKSLRVIRFYQRRIIESQIKILQKYVIYVSLVQDIKKYL